MDYLPVFLDIRGRRVLVDGGDTIAARRVERALAAGAKVTAFDPKPGQEMLGLADNSGLTIHTRLPRRGDLTGCAVAYGASEKRTRDQHLYDWSREENVLCNIADWTENCDFITPSIVDRSPIVIAISTGGAAPVIARILRARIESIVPSAFGQLASFTGTFRDRIASAIKTGRGRRRFWERMIDGPAGDMFLNGNTDRAHQQITDDLEQYVAGSSQKTGEVYLVGAGPGDPDLLTFRALRLMQRCDVILYDRLVGEDIMSLVRRDARRIYVGKMAQEHTMAQEDISDLMVRLAKQGNRVLRLKGGDPFIFGRGGEEIEKLAENGIAFQVVPGITAAAGCGAYAGIPLTHRDHAQACTFVTAHGKDGALALDWKALIHPGQTVAVYMGLANLPVLAEGARALGVDMSTPVAIVQNGTRQDQVVVTGTLADIAGRAEAAELKSPAMIIIGSVVTLRDRLNWTGNYDGGQVMALSSSTTPDVIANRPG
jgi:uroporphyrin-III C-methyltransferase / precorrin-2 dehydrogenase / sirohydrochlorin ferrochelatase